MRYKDTPRKAGAGIVVQGMSDSCPLDYRYDPRVLARPAEIIAETLYVAGGLYGNRFALDTILELCEKEQSPVTLVFNGDFNWFNTDPDGFVAINHLVSQHRAIRGNVETELARDGESADCGCDYPEWVESAVVERSNQIFARLKTVARRLPDVQQRLRALPMNLVADIGGVRIGIVHGDAVSLAGWSFSQEALCENNSAILDWFAAANVTLFACTHTCLPVLQGIGTGMIANNGAAGMPNFRDSRFGLLTRISIFRGEGSVLNARLGRLYVDLLPIRYDHERWLEEFLRNWPPGSPAHESYFDRIVRGPNYTIAQALRV